MMGGAFPKESEIIQTFPILEFIYSLIINQDDIVYQIKLGKKNKRIIYNEVNQGLNFDLSKDRRKFIIENAYNNTIEHIENILKI